MAPCQNPKKLQKRGTIQQVEISTLLLTFLYLLKKIPCAVLHKVKVFIDYAQGLVQLLLLIFTSMISFLHFLSSRPKAALQW